MLEISVIRNNELIWTSNRQQRRSLDNFAKKVLEDKKLTITVCLIIIITALTLSSTLADVFYPACIAASSLGLAGSKIKGIMNEIIGFAKVVLIGMVIFKTILEVIQHIWKNTGSKMSYDEIFGILFKNLAILTVGLSVDKVCWWLYGLLA